MLRFTAGTSTSCSRPQHRLLSRQGPVHVSSRRESDGCRPTAPPPSLPPFLPLHEAARLSFAAAAAALILTSATVAPALAKPGSLDLQSCSAFVPATRGIAFCEVQVGSGEVATSGDLVEIDYTARATATGKVYDGSRKFKFTLGNEEIIPGWELGILGDGPALPAMREGGVRTLLVPPELAFGKAGDGCLYGLDNSCRIPPNSPVEITTAFHGSAYFVSRP